jgi:hypothetical protein
MRDEILDLLNGDNHILLKRKPIGDRIPKNIVDFIEVLVNVEVGKSE